VSARLNTDRKETNETVYDPDGRVEQSVRVSRQNENARNTDGAAPATVTEELPEDALGEQSASGSSEESERRDETTEYAISSRTTATRSDGYRLEALSVAVVVNRAALEAVTPAPDDAAADAAAADAAAADPAAAQAALDARLAQLRGIIAAAAGIDEARGDTINLTAISFAPAALDAATEPGFSVGGFFSNHSGSLIRALALLAVTGLILLFAVRPALRVAQAQTQAPALESEVPGGQRLAGPEAPGSDDPAADIAAKIDNAARKRLERIIALDEDKAVAVIKQWLRQGETGQNGGAA
jgi:flagellar M-ring protein FliF